MSTHMQPTIRSNTFSACASPSRSRAFPSCQPRPAFTLVELLVVIAIIGMITAIAVPTIFSAIGSARNAKTKAEVDMLHMALMNYKNEYGSFPPADMAGLWTSSGVYPKHPAYKHLVRIFPRLSELTTTVNSPYYSMSRMSPAQALVFWLRGFYENPEFPLTNGLDQNGNAVPGTRKRHFDFDESRLYAASMPYSFSSSSPQTFTARSSSTPSAEEKSYPVYFTGHASAGLPYVYFDSRCYDTEPNLPVAGGGTTKGDKAYYAQSLAISDSSAAWPYVTPNPPINPTWGQRHTSPETFQLIAAGRDGSYGTVAAAFPAAVTIVTGYNTISCPSADDVINAIGHADNITNFADRPLADAIDSLQSR